MDLESNISDKEKIFISQFEKDKPYYSLWMNYIIKILNEDPRLCSLYKIPISGRIKDIDSLIEKAFYRGKNYTDPYNDITDKVGIRIVVLLCEHIDILSNFIKSESSWDASEDRHFEKERQDNPTIFTYQSVHYVLRAKGNINYQNTPIPNGIACELQIRTLLQHSYSELTHDTIYKSKTIASPYVQRKIARSMALIESTDEIFTDVSQILSKNDDMFTIYMDKLTDLYLSINPAYKPSGNINTIILDEYNDFLSIDNLKLLENYITDYMPILLDTMTHNLNSSRLYQQPCILFIIYMLHSKKIQFVRRWPLPIEQLESIANLLGYSIMNL